VEKSSYDSFYNGSLSRQIRVSCPDDVGVVSLGMIDSFMGTSAAHFPSYDRGLVLSSSSLLKRGLNIMRHLMLIDSRMAAGEKSA